MLKKHCGGMDAEPPILHFSFALLFSALHRSARNAQGHRYRKPQAFFTIEKQKQI